MTPRVFAVQQPSRLIVQADGRKKWVASQDLSPALEHGPMILILRPGNLFKGEVPHVQAVIERTLYQRNFSADDFLLQVGDPIASALTLMIAAERTGGRVKLLKWLPRTVRYEPYEINLRGNNYHARHDARNDNGGDTSREVERGSVGGSQEDASIQQNERSDGELYSQSASSNGQRD
jgi:hypothetical protein